jgi:hypothetical protein
MFNFFEFFSLCEFAVCRFSTLAANGRGYVLVVHVLRLRQAQSHIAFVGSCFSFFQSLEIDIVFISDNYCINGLKK